MRAPLATINLDSAVNRYFIYHSVLCCIDLVYTSKVPEKFGSRKVYLLRLHETSSITVHLGFPFT